MTDQKKNRDRYLTILIILVSVAGVLYFGFRAIMETNISNQENPFEYNIEHFKKSDSALFLYTEIRQIGLNLDNPRAVAVGPADRIYVSGDRVIQTREEKGNIIQTIDCDEPVNALSVDASGNIVAAMERRIQIFDSTGLPAAGWEAGDDNTLITSIAVHLQGLYIADADNRKVWHYDRSGRLVKTIGPGVSVEGIPEFIIPSPYFDVAVDPDGFLWVVNTGNHLLENFTPDGTYRASWGIYSMTIEGFSGCCNPSHIAIMSDGSFVTSEKGIPRVKVYNAAGKLTGVVAGPEEFAEGTAGLDLAVDSRNRIIVLDPVKKSIRFFKNKATPNPTETSG
jgi:hypothetical protein